MQDLWQGNKPIMLNYECKYKHSNEILESLQEQIDFTGIEVMGN